MSFPVVILFEAARGRAVLSQWVIGGQSGTLSARPARAARRHGRTRRGSGRSWTTNACSASSAQAMLGRRPRTRLLRRARKPRRRICHSGLGPALRRARGSDRKEATLSFSTRQSVLSRLRPRGCNLECKCCQNWDISQSRPEEVDWHWMPPKKSRAGRS